MNLTDDQKIQIFAAVLNAVIQADAVSNEKNEVSVVQRASAIAVQAVAKLQSKDWARPDGTTWP